MKKLNMITSAFFAAAILSSCAQSAEEPVKGNFVSYETTTSENSETSEKSEITTESISDKQSSDSRDTISERKAAASESSEESKTEIILNSEPEIFFETEESVTSVPEISAILSTTETEVPTAETEENSETASTLKKKSNKKNLDGNYLDFFSDSLFVGDSICSGLKVYGGLLDTEHVAARGNVASRSIDNYTFQYKNNSTAEMSALEIVEYYQPDDIFIWMGMNDLLCISDEKFTENMTNIAADYLEVSPDSRIHIVSMSPMASTHKWNINNDGNNRINTYNKKMKEICDNTDYIDFINIHDCLTNNSGYLASENDGGDGIHLSSAAYKKVLNEIYNYMTTEVLTEEKTNDNEKTDETTITETINDNVEENVSETAKATETEEESVTSDENEETSTENEKSEAEKFREFFFNLKNKQ